MNLFGDFNFFVYLIIALIPAIILGIKEKKIKYYSLILTFFFVIQVINKDYKQLFFLIFYTRFELCLVKINLYIRKKLGKNRFIYGNIILFAILPLILCKITSGANLNIFGFIGISYLTFRVVQIVIESYDGLIEDINTIDFIMFLFFFPTLSSGPIDRSRRFTEDINKTYTKTEYLDLLGTGIQKISLGVFYKFVLSEVFYAILLKITGHFWPQYIFAYAYVYGFYMFFDFAGYSLMAIGTSYILGVKMPENFNKPFISIDINDFWNRWHITLSHWFRDFIFTRFMLDSMKNKRFDNKIVTAFVGFMINMTIMGIWHGLSKNYILYGIYHGFLLGINEIYQKKSKFYKKYKNRKIYKVFSWFITINCVMFGFLIFSGYFDSFLLRCQDVLLS